ncbi:MAG: histidinol-phosphatase [Alphaproteobacteria bacterium]|nr:histidinol-phosphatase [Alphaproteobacteria bacterium]
MSETVPADLVAFAGTLADAARAVILPYFRSGLAVEDKADTSPVTIADREAEAAMRKLIEARYPDHGINGEEHGVVRADAEYVWVLDPIDGTKSFLIGQPSFVTLIGLARRGRPVLGVVDQPITRERWIGGAGHPTTHNGKPTRTAPCAGLAQAKLNATSHEMFRGANGEAFARVRSRIKQVTFGGDGYAVALIALGSLDLVIEARLQYFDYCALVPVIEAAGGVATDWQGQPLGPDSDGRICMAGDARVHREALQALAGK